MSDPNEAAHQAFQQELSILVSNIEKAFGASLSRTHYNDETEVLYIEVQGLENFSEDKIAEITEPILDETDLDFEEIILLPLKSI